MAQNLDVIAANYERTVFKFCRGVITNKAVLWEGAAAYTGWLAAAASCEIISDSADDKVGSGGAVNLTVVGQGDDGLEISETKALNGDTGPVALTNEYKIIYRAFCPDSEDNDPITGGNHGTITIRRTAGPITMATILPTFIIRIL